MKIDRPAIAAWLNFPKFSRALLPVILPAQGMKSSEKYWRVMTNLP
jgi:hypothetical protein